MSYIYTFIRKDLSHAQKIVQIGHACYEAGKKFQDNQGISSLILLSAEDEDDLKVIAEKLEERGIQYYMFFEPNNEMGYSAICTEPITTNRDRNFFKKWKLYSHAD